MRFIFLTVTLLLSVTKLTESQRFKLSQDEVDHLQSRGFGPTVASTAYATTGYLQEDTQTAASQQRISTAYPDEPYYYQNVIPVKQKVQPVIQQQQQQVVRPRPQQFRVNSPPEPRERKNEKDLKELEEEEIEEPDRLSLLLPQSKFVCNGKNTGYYADEELGCEVFHYCQDNARHSWICPEGFTFHQVHLICMPPGGDNICEKSSQYHFVNEYLYKPLNLEEFQRKPNVSLRYSDRYYPDSYYEEEEEEERPVNHHRNSIRVNQEATVAKPLLVQPVARTTYRPETTLAQVFRSPNEVNIPLQNRRPQQYLTQRYQ